MDNENKSMSQYELERKFLLKRLPEVEELPRVLYIEQYYIHSDGIITRYRSELEAIDGHDSIIKFYKTVKTPMKEGSFKEDETEISRVEYDEPLTVVEACRGLAKSRFVWERNTHSLCIDVYLDMHLIIAEMEMISAFQADIEKLKQYPIDPYIKDALILEVTGLKEFSNYNLSHLDWKMTI